MIGTSDLFGNDIFSLAVTRSTIRSHLGEVSVETEEAIEAAVERSLAKAKQHIQEQLSQMTSFETEIVNVLPDIAEAQTNVIYFVPKSLSDLSNTTYWEYMLVNGKWELIGDTQFDLSEYVTKDQLQEYISGATFFPATADRLGGVKVDPESFNLEDDGKISITPISSEDIHSLF